MFNKMYNAPVNITKTSLFHTVYAWGFQSGIGKPLRWLPLTAAAATAFVAHGGEALVNSSCKCIYCSSEKHTDELYTLAITHTTLTYNYISTDKIT